MHVASVTTYDKFLEVDSAVQNMNLGFHPHLCLISTSHIPPPSSGTFGTSCQIPLLSFPAFCGQQGEAPGLTPYRGLSTKQCMTVCITVIQACGEKEHLLIQLLFLLPGWLRYHGHVLLGWKSPVRKSWSLTLSPTRLTWIPMSMASIFPLFHSLLLQLQPPAKLLPQALCTFFSCRPEHPFPRYSFSSISHFISVSALVSSSQNLPDSHEQDISLFCIPLSGFLL